MGTIHSAPPEHIFGFVMVTGAAITGSIRLDLQARSDTDGYVAGDGHAATPEDDNA